MKTISSTKKYFQISVAFFVITVVLYIVLEIVIGRQKVALESVLVQIAEQNSFTDQYSSLSAVVEESQSDRDYLQHVVIDGEDGVVSFLSQIDTLAVATGVTVTTSELKAVKEEGARFGYLTVTFAVTGNATAVPRFMYALELLPYAKEFTMYRISQVADGTTDAGASGAASLQLIMK